MEDIRDLIPKDKHDTERAKAAVAAGYPAIAPIILEILDCTWDPNWPIARIVIPFINSIHLQLIPHAQQVMNTGDEKQKYWLMDTLLSEYEDIAVVFREELIRIAYSPTENEATEKLNEMAQQTLKSHGWHQTN